MTNGNNMPPEAAMQKAGIKRLEPELPPSNISPFPGNAPQEEKPPAPLITATPFEWKDPKTIRPRPWLYAKHYIRKIMNMTVAPGGLGKSSLVLTEALAMVSGKPLLGHEVRKPLRVWVWNGEDPFEEMERRAMGAAVGHNLCPEDIEDRLFLDVGRDQPICVARTIPQSGTVIMEPVRDAILAQLKAREIDVLIIDPFVSCHAASENDNNAIEIVASVWRDIADKADCAIELVHHSRKTNGAEVNAESARGGVSLTSAARDVRTLNRMTPEEADTAGIDRAKARSYFRTFSDKGNMAPPAEASEWYELRGVPLDNGTEEEEGDWIGVPFCFDYCPKGLFSDFTNEQVRQAQDAIASAPPEERKASSQAAGWIGHLIAPAFRLDSQDKGEKRTLTKMIAEWERNEILKRDACHDGKAARPILTLINRSGEED